MKWFLKNLGKRCLKLVFLACGRMDEAELVGVKAEPAQAVVGGTILLVAYDGMAKVLGMDANLVLASRLLVEVD